MITIKVKVYGGVAPIPIEVFIDKDVNSHEDDIIIRSPISFQQDVPLTPGEYAIIVSGKNPIDGRTEIIITGVDSNGNNINLSKTKTVSNYFASFILNI